MIKQRTRREVAPKLKDTFIVEDEINKNPITWNIMKGVNNV
ncbi:MAG TPA: hypothetical protein VFG77_08035 [Nitrososphaeraceae archaeon]|nr:hypothetical protein [Nitrososphaeraceae archaeon]